MGAKAQILLVILALHAGLASAAEVRVAAQDHQAFWLWSGVKTTAALRGAETVYLHQGEVLNVGGRIAFQRLGLPVSKLAFPQIWLTVRFGTLEVPGEVLQRVVRLLDRWRLAGNQVVGLQIDFDAATHRLDEYQQFLLQVRRQLPPSYALGVTGLLDWAKTGSVQTLNRLPVDELVIQSYQGRHTVTRYEDYLPALAGLQIPFKLGLVQHGRWDTRYERSLASMPWYRGTVIFMLNAAAGEIPAVAP